MLKQNSQVQIKETKSYIRKNETRKEVVPFQTNHKPVQL